MADSDDEYIQDVTDDDEADLNMADIGGGSYGTRAKGKRTTTGTEPLGKHGTNGTGQRTRAPVKQSWERSEKRDVGILKEGIEGPVNEEARKRKRLRQDTEPFQRGIIRHVMLVLDLSEAMLEKDMRPNRFIVMIKYAQEYIREFFEQNPISQMSIMAMYDGICTRVSELSGNPTDHVNALLAIRNPRDSREIPMEPKGSPSLQNALDVARANLYHTPPHGTREVIIILGALLSLDPGDINKTIIACVENKLRVSIIGMSGRLRICQEICARTNGGDESSYVVAQDQIHFRELLLATTTPPVIRSSLSTNQTTTPASLLMMGFPSRVFEEATSLCSCHGWITKSGYSCSRCKAKVCALPITCPSCGLTLILSTHLARSYHHLFPLRNWIEVSWQRAILKWSTQCKGCLKPFPKVPDTVALDSKQHVENGDLNTTLVHQSGELVKPLHDGPSASESSRYECQVCGNHFCVDCDVFAHEVVHNCPGCLSDTHVSGEVMDVG